MNNPFVPGGDHRKCCKLRNRGVCKNGNILNFGIFGIQSLERGNVKDYHLKTIRVAVTNFFKRNVKVWIRVQPNLNHTKKPKEVRLGRGKGSIEYWYFRTKPGRLLMEFGERGSLISLEEAKTVTSVVNSKLPFKVKLVYL